MTEWNMQPLAQLLKIQNGWAFGSSEFGATGMPLIRIRDLKLGVGTEIRYSGSFDAAYVVRSGDLLIGMDGEFQCYEWKGNEALLNQRVCRLHSFSAQIEPRFLRYGINKYLKDIEDVTGYTTVKHLSSKQILAIQFPVPPVAEQKRIVAILDRTVEAICVARENYESNLSNKNDLFRSYLTDLLQQRGKGWRDEPLSKVCVVERGSSPRPIKKYFTTDTTGVNWIKIGDTEEGGKYVISTGQKITPEGATQSRYVRKGDLILTNSMSYGRPYIMATDGYIHDGWFVLRPSNDLNTEFFYYVLSSQQVQRQFEQLASGSVVKNISGDLVKQAVVPIPPIPDQLEIVQKLGRLETDVERLGALYNNKLLNLDALNESIFEQAFSGAL